MILSIVIFVISIASSAFFVYLLLTSKSYDNFIEPIDSKEFQLKEIFGAGFKLTQILKIDFKSKRANALRSEAIILYGEKYGDYYLRVLYAQKFAVCFLVFIVACVFACFADVDSKLIMFGLGILLAGVLYYYFETNSTKKIGKRSVMFLGEFPNAIATIALLVNSGMMLREAWSDVAYSSDEELYLQMQKVTEDINNGKSESDALYAFALRCATPEIKKFTSFIVQGLEKGSKDLAYALKTQSEELWEMKKQSVLQQGELASSKLLIPIMIMFIGILIMVIGPIMTNLGIG